MTDQRPFPPTGPDGAPPRKARRASLIERAGGSDDWHRVVAPAATAPLSESAASRAVAPVAPFAAPAFDPAGLPATAPLRDGPVAARLDASPAPQVFRGTFHIIDRTHLRDQGLIEPEGPVTALFQFRTQQIPAGAAVKAAMDQNDIGHRVSPLSMFCRC